jgi:transposase-like protein
MAETDRLLREDTLSVKSMALLLGYGDVSNFRHACRRWYRGFHNEYRQRVLTTYFIKTAEIPPPRYGDTFYIGEVFVKINGKRRYLCRALDQDGEVADVYLQARRDGAAVNRFFKRLLRSHGNEPRKIVTDKLRSYVFAHRELFPETIHVTECYANN